MFLARLDEAKERAERDMYRTSPNKPNGNKHGSDIVNDEKIIKEEPCILEKCSEYLFDLFDANLTPEYRRIDLIQEKAIRCFDRSLSTESTGSTGSQPGGKSNVTEYTFEQERLHCDFKDVFEQLISDFLYDEQMSLDDFHSILKKSYSGPKLGKIVKKGRQSKFANEILDCVMWYTDFECWANSMRAEAKYRKKMCKTEAEHEEEERAIASAAREYRNTDRIGENMGDDCNSYEGEEKNDDVRAIRGVSPHRFAEVLL